MLSFLIAGSLAAMAPQPTVLQVWLTDVKRYVPVPLPPERYSGLDPITTKVTFVQDVKEKCGPGIIACTEIDTGDITIPNPCQYPHDDYARVLCHELGHTRGWPATHPDERWATPLIELLSPTSP